MAHIIEETIVITLSQIAKNGDGASDTVINAELLSTLEAVVQEIVGNKVVVEAFVEEK